MLVEFLRSCTAGQTDATLQILGVLVAKLVRLELPVRLERGTANLTHEVRLDLFEREGGKFDDT